MQGLQRTIQTILTHLRGLSATARLLIGALMVIVVMALLFVAMYAGNPSLVPLALPANVSQEVRTKAASFIQARGIPLVDRGGQLLVPREQSYAILAELMDGQMITGDQIDFSTLVAQESPFSSREHNQKLWLSTKMKVLERMIGKMSGIESAVVVIDEPRGMPGIGKAFTGPSASVTVVTRSTGLAQHQVDAIATAVARAHAGLKVEDVAVIDARAGKRHQARGSQDMDGSRYLDLKQEYERVVKQKVEELLPIAGLKVAVNAIVDTRREEKRIQEFDKPQVAPLSSETRSTSAGSQARSGEPAVLPNAGASVTPSPAAATSSKEEESRERTQPVFPSRNSLITDPKGHALQINVAVGVPKSYFERVYQDEQGDAAAKPDKAALDAVVEAEQARIRQQIEPLIVTAPIDGAAPGQIVVSMIRDFAQPGLLGEGVSSESAGGSWFASSGGGDGLVKYVGLGTLALLSLTMMFLMVRKAGHREQMDTAQESAKLPKALGADEGDLVGEADESAPAMEGIELDEAQLRKQQMVRQVNEMIITKPDEAATVVRKWLRTEG